MVLHPETTVNPQVTARTKAQEKKMSDEKSDSANDCDQHGQKGHGCTADPTNSDVRRTFNATEERPFRSGTRFR
jgi:hypothetical protein